MKVRYLKVIDISNALNNIIINTEKRTCNYVQSNNMFSNNNINII